MCGTDTRTDRSQLTGVWKTNVANAFDRAAEQYDKLANIQRKVAGELMQRIAESMDASEVKAALEIGCGTGFLTNPLLTHFSNTDWVVSDVSPKMVQACRQLMMESNLERSSVRFRPLDAEQLGELVTESLPFDLICSSLAFQWLTDLPKTLAGMFDRLKSGGQIHFTTLAETNFRSLYDNFPLSGLEERAPKFPSVAAIEAALQKVGASEIEIAERRYSEAYPNLQSLLRHLKSIGAATANQQSNPRDTAALRKAIKESRDSGHRAIADYHVLFVSAKKSG